MWILGVKEKMEGEVTGTGEDPVKVEDEVTVGTGEYPVKVEDGVTVGTGEDPMRVR